MKSVMLEQLMYASYFAPRGRARMYILGQQISERYLSPLDRLIGVIGDSGAGKSSIIKGMFPGLELTNDDEQQMSLEEMMYLQQNVIGKTTGFKTIDSPYERDITANSIYSGICDKNT